MTPITLTPADLLLAAVSLLIASGLSVVLTLGIHRPLAIAALRMAAQLVLVGLMLRHVFALASPGVTLLIVAAMIGAAAWEVQSRQKLRFRGWLRFGLGGLPVAIATVFVTGMALSTSLREAAWLDARHTIPLVGIILGTVMNSTSLALNAMLTGIRREQRAIEARLALGANGALALRELRLSATHNGLIPVINQMAGAGIITLPGIMTGQVLTGMDPLDAAKYQILLMLLLAGAGAIGVIVATQLCLRAVTDKRDRLRLDRLEKG
ncbi:ABC transporter permease [Paenirhodobacter sp.]|uniref:ABC transporter permease n=1 Tax=Paenirhodobacter sp. TaxID=1965326 RepID=UPI003B4170E2